MLTEATACLYTTGSCERTRTSLQARTTRGAPAGTQSHPVPAFPAEPPLPVAAPSALPGRAKQRPEPLGRRGEEGALGFQSGRRRGAADLPQRGHLAALPPAPPPFPSPYSHRPLLRAGRRGVRSGGAGCPPAGPRQHRLRRGERRGGEGNGPPSGGPTGRITNKAAANWRAGGARLSLRRMAAMARGQPGSGAGSRTEAAAGSGPRVPSRTQKLLGSRAGGAAL